MRGVYRIKRDRTWRRMWGHVHSRKACAVVTCNSTEPRGLNYHTAWISFSSTANHTLWTLYNLLHSKRISPPYWTCIWYIDLPLSHTLDMQTKKSKVDSYMGTCVGLIPVWCSLHLSCVQSPSVLLWRLGLQLPRLQRSSQNSKRYIRLLLRKAFKRTLSTTTSSQVSWRWLLSLM